LRNKENEELMMEGGLKMTTDFKDVMDGYYSCNSCGVYVDDGSFNNSKYLCHDCIDKENVLGQKEIEERLVDIEKELYEFDGLNPSKAEAFMPSKMVEELEREKAGLISQMKKDLNKLPIHNLFLRYRKLARNTNSAMYMSDGKIDERYKEMWEIEHEIQRRLLSHTES
jgi:hypothetical protein